MYGHEQKNKSESESRNSDDRTCQSPVLGNVSESLSFSVKPCSYTVEEEVSQWPLSWSQFI